MSKTILKKLELDKLKYHLYHKGIGCWYPKNPCSKVAMYWTCPETGEQASIYDNRYDGYLTVGLSAIKYVREFKGLL